MRRRRNRKKVRANAAAVPLPFAVVIVLAATLALAYVWLDYCEESIGREIKDLEKQREVLNKKYLSEEYKWTCTKSPPSLAAALDRLGITMVYPDGRRQVVHLYPTKAAEGKLADLRGGRAPTP